ncbi:MAG: glycosyltransferase family 2 protein [Lachnospiraceae bacterium]|nr:glycosyltransferase family 2 protein [Lachnospiraceae bacterium]
MAKVSVIMPSLNVAAYIDEAVESVLRQTLEDIEVICVDAGSTDGTWEKLEGYASSDGRLKLIRSDKKSYGYQMNLGISEAAGDYIGIVETDDYIELDMYERLYDAAIETNADIVKSDFDMFITGDNGQRIYVPYSLRKLNRVKYGRTYSSEDYMNGTLKPECYIWNAIYRKGFLTEKDICFNETPGASFQDFGFRYQVTYLADRIVAVDHICYHYRRDNMNASTYNPMTAEYNLRETEYILGILKKRFPDADRVLEAFAKEVIEYAFWPYFEVLKWSHPAEGTAKAFEGFREIISGFLEKGYVKEGDIDGGLWLAANLLADGVETFLGYARVVSRLDTERISAYLSRVREASDVIVFGSGLRGNNIYAFLVSNGINSIRAFCDNDTGRQGDSRYGVGIMAPEEAAGRYAEAIYIITVSLHEQEIREQLENTGVAEERILSYALPIDPHFCTNSMMKKRM